MPADIRRKDMDPFGSIHATTWYSKELYKDFEKLARERNARRSPHE
jgi:hypothetical protein